MTKRVNEIDVKILLFAIQRTANFESLCARRFVGRTLALPDKVSSQYTFSPETTCSAQRY